MQNATTGPQTMVYSYDQLNRITGSDQLGAVLNGANIYDNGGVTNNYKTRYTYDHNGNIASLKRYDDLGVLMDDMVYHYKNDGNGDPINQLRHVVENAPGSVQTDDIEPMLADNYSYNDIGQLTGDASEEIDAIVWNNAAKVRHILRDNTSSKEDLEFVYGPMGNRIVKIVKPKSAPGVLSTQEHWTYTYYLRDAQGNVMAVYNRKFDDSDPEMPMGMDTRDVYVLSEHHIYGSDRCGLQSYDGDPLSTSYVDISGYNADNTINGIWQTPVVSQQDNYLAMVQGDKYYECKNHLGNVLAVISDRNLLNVGLSIEANFTAGDPENANWTAVNNSYPHIIPAQRLRVNTTAPLDGVSRVFDTEVGAHYRIEFDYHYVHTNHRVWVYIKSPGATSNYIERTASHQTPRMFVEFIAQDTQTELQILVRVPNGPTSSSFEIDNVTIKKTPVIPLNATFENTLESQSETDRWIISNLGQ